MSCESGSQHTTRSSPGTAETMSATISSWLPIARAVSAQPLGMRVEPEEYWMNARSSSSGGVSSTMASRGSDSQLRSGSCCPSDSGTAWSSFSSSTSIGDATCSHSCPSCAAYSSRLIPRAGIGSEATAPPANQTPMSPATASYEFVRTVATTVPGPTPASRRPAAMRRASASRSGHVRRSKRPPSQWWSDPPLAEVSWSKSCMRGGRLQRVAPPEGLDLELADRLVALVHDLPAARDHPDLVRHVHLARDLALHVNRVAEEDGVLEDHVLDPAQRHHVVVRHEADREADHEHPVRHALAEDVLLGPRHVAVSRMPVA